MSNCGIGNCDSSSQDSNAIWIVEQLVSLNFHVTEEQVRKSTLTKEILHLLIEVR